jgi:hypothetical protein
MGLGVTRTLRGVSFDGDAGAAVGDGGNNYFSTDGGVSWSIASLSVTDDLEAVRYLNAGLDTVVLDTFITAGRYVRLFCEYPTPGFLEPFYVAWTIDPPQRLHAVDRSGPSYWVAGDSGFVGVGAIDDTTLVDRSLPDPVTIKSIVAIDSSRLYVAGDGGAIYYTADAGLTWYRQLTGDTHDLEAIAFAGNGRGYAVGNGGTILRTDLPGTLTGVSGGAPALPSAFRLYQNYPNPFNPATTIAFDIPVDATVTIEIFDVLGRRVAVPADGFHPAGPHNVVWDAGRQSSGVYFAVMRASDRSGRAVFRDAKKLLLVR